MIEISDPLFQKQNKLFKIHRSALDLLDLQSVFLTESNQNIMIGFCKIVHDTVDIGFDIFRAPDIKVFVRTDMQRVGNAEMIPEELV